MGVYMLLTVLSAAFITAEETKARVTCGSVVKLQHAATFSLLQSQEVAYQYGGGGSGQQSVTGYNGGDDFGSYWAVKLPKDQNCSQGTPIKHHTIVKLQHQATRRWLHSHKFQSPLSRSQEVSAFGDDDTSDTADHWLLELDGVRAWTVDQRFRLKHKDTGHYLSMNKYQYGRPISGHLEVCATKSKDQNGWWRSTEGVYFKPRETEEL